MKISQLYLLQPYNRVASVSKIGESSFSIICESREVILKIHNQELTDDFLLGCTTDWVEFVLSDSGHFLIDEGGIMDEYVFCLN